MTEDKAMSNARQQFSDFLKKNCKRQTPERFAILERVLTASGHVSVEEFHSALDKEGFHVSLATVYSTFQLLCQAGLLRKHTFQDRHAEYERLAVSGAHIHLICSVCGNVRERRDTEMEALVRRSRYPLFAQTDFSLYVYGVCSRCQRAARRKSARASSSKNTCPKKKTNIKNQTSNT